MRVHFIGNTCNNHYVIVKALRALGMDAHLYLPHAHTVTPQTRPESEDPALLEDGYPPWIHSLARVGGWRPLGAFARRDVKKLAACDLVVTHGEYAWELDGRVPYIVYPHGADLYKYPFERFRSTRLLNLAPGPKYWGVRGRMRKGFAGAEAIIYHTISFLYDRAIRHFYPGKRIAAIGFAIDMARFVPRERRSDDLKGLFPEYDFFVFQQSRQMWTPRTASREASKGNDILFRAFARFRREAEDAVLVCIDKGDYDVQASKELVRSLGIERHVRWLPAVPRHQLVKFLHGADVMVESLSDGGYGSSAVEAMSCGTPVLMHLHHARWKAVYGSIPPVLRATSDDEVFSRLQQLRRDPALAEHTSSEQLEFVRAIHESGRVASQFCRLFNSIIGTGADFDFVPDSALTV